jgi:hypothetical protein
VSLAQARRLAKLVGAGPVRRAPPTKVVDVKGAYRLGRGMTLVHLPDGSGCFVVDDNSDDVRLDLSAPGDLAEGMLRTMVERQRAAKTPTKRPRGRK